MDNVIYYILALLVIVIAIVVIKKVAGCIIKSIAFAIAVGEEVPTGMWTDPNALYPLSVPLDDMFDCGIG